MLVNVKTMTFDELVAYVEKYSKVANRRLYQIEKAGLTRGSNAYRYVEGKLANNVTRRAFMTKGEKPRFKESQKKLTKTEGQERVKAIGQLRAEAAELNVFLNEAKTSSVKGINAKYRKAFETFTGKKFEATERDEEGSIIEDSGVKHIKGRRVYKGLFDDENGKPSFEKYSAFWADDTMRKAVQMFGSQVILELRGMLSSEFEETIEAAHNNATVTDMSTFVDNIRREVYGDKTEETDTIKNDEIKLERIK